MKLKKFLTKIYKGKYIKIKKDGKCIGNGLASTFVEITNEEIMNMQIKAIEPVNDEMINIFIGEENG